MNEITGILLHACCCMCVIAYVLLHVCCCACIGMRVAAIVLACVMFCFSSMSEYDLFTSTHTMLQITSLGH